MTERVRFIHDGGELRSLMRPDALKSFLCYNPFLGTDRRTLSTRPSSTRRRWISGISQHAVLRERVNNRLCRGTLQLCLQLC